MNKKGFTLIELLIVLAIVAVASAGSILVFDRADAENSKKKLKDTYIRIQRAATVYLEMNDSWRNQFNEKGYIYLKINELQNENFLEQDLIDDTTFSEINSNNLILVYMDNKTETIGGKTVNFEYVGTCVVSNDAASKCIANSSGDSCNCYEGKLAVGTGNNPRCE